MVSFEEFSALAVTHNVIPILRRSMADTLTPVSAYLALRKEGVPSFILESVEREEKIGRYSFIGIDPVVLVQARGTVSPFRKVRLTQPGSRAFSTVCAGSSGRYHVAPFAEPHASWRCCWVCRL